ncbi:amino acid ABC transporter substrate-binding protein [Fusibacter sp. JL298sf-3]
MRNKKTIAGLIALASIVLLAVFFLRPETAPSSAEDTVIKVGMSGGYQPYTYLDENGELTGFDVDVWKAIGEQLDMEIEFVTSNFSGLFGMLDTGKIDTIANQITITPEREEKYLFTSPYVYYGAQLITKDDRDDIYDLASLKGKKVAVGLGTNYETMLREFDTEGSIEIITYDSGSGSYQDVAIGRVDAAMNDRLALQSVIKTSGLPLKLAGDPINELHNAFPFVVNDKNRALIAKIDAAIETLYTDGTMAELSQRYFDINITERFDH